MNKRLGVAALIAALTGAGGAGGFGVRTATAAGLAAQATVTADDLSIRALLQRIEEVTERGDIAGYLSLLSAAADRSYAEKFVALEFRSGAANVVIQERDRQDLPGTLPGNGYTLVVDVFTEYGDRARVASWLLEVRRVEEEWRVAGQERLSAVENLFRLSLNSQKQFDATNFIVVSEDLELTLTEGTVFVIETERGVTGMVLLGRGEMKFHPPSETEKGQVRIFAGADTLETRFDTAYLRLGSLDGHLDLAMLRPRPVDPKDLRRAEQVFREESPKTFVVELADLTRDTWSLLPAADDFLAEVRTRRFETLTYARSSAEPEDISVFERRRHRNIAVYPSQQKLATRGRFYNEDELAPFDVLHYDIDVVSNPDREWIDGRTVMRLRVRDENIGQLSIRLADPLVVRSVSSNQFGRLFNLRVSNQNMVLVNLPGPVPKNTVMTVTIEYSGRLEPQAPDRETLALGGQLGPPSAGEDLPFRPEPSFLFSNRSYWYPQSTVSDFATANLQITVPALYSCVASGVQATDSPQLIADRDASQARKVYQFTAQRPVRYLAFVVSRLTRADRWNVAFDDEPSAGGVPKALPGLGPDYSKLDLIVDTNPRQSTRGRDLAERAVDVVQFYESIVGDSPYSALNVALIESMLPGGHSPGYFAIVNQALPYSNVSWRNDPAAFYSYPEFFLAHEVAHQWWGQAVAWRNYHEQWLSEGFSQYFAALYAEKYRGDEVFANVMRQMRRWAIDQSDQGPVYLGYRIGHIKNDGRAFRAIIYNKGAAVLHMLRRLLGDDVFFRGVRRFYSESRFTKIGTEDFQRAMEAESGRPLDRFFERWIYSATLPRVTLSYRVEGQSVVLHFEQTGDVFDVPVTVTLQYVDRKPVNVVVPVTDKVVEQRVPLEGNLRAIEVSRDDGTLADVTLVR